MSTPQRVVAVDVGGTNLKGAVVDRLGRALSASRRPAGADVGPHAVIEAVIGLACELADWGGSQERPAAIGLAVPGLVDEDTGTVLDAANLRFRGVRIGPIVEEQLGVQVAVRHDVRAGALVEGLLGAARGHRDYLFVTLGTGIGSAIVIGGRPYTGAHGIGGELGHMAIEPGGPICGCGRPGCLEALASARHIAARYRRRTGRNGSAGGAEEVADLAASGDPIAGEIWSEAIDALAIAIANYATLLDPELVVIGGGMAAAGDGLFEPLRHRVAAHTRFGDPPALLPAALGAEAGRRGAAICAWRAAGIDEAELAAWQV